APVAGGESGPCRTTRRIGTCARRAQAGAPDRGNARRPGAGPRSRRPPRRSPAGPGDQRAPLPTRPRRRLPAMIGRSPRGSPCFHLPLGFRTLPGCHSAAANHGEGVLFFLSGACQRQEKARGSWRRTEEPVQRGGEVASARRHAVEVHGVWDSDAEVWSDEAGNMRGLVTDAGTTDAVVSKLRVMVP